MSSLQQIYDRLLEAYGPQQWWPGESPLEVMVGAVLVQNTAWKNVEKAIENLREADLLHPQRLYQLDAEQLSQLIRPAGYYRLKTSRLRNLLKFVVQRYDGSLDRMFAGDMAQLREELLQVNGIGPETADSILLYAGHLPSFVVDNYTLRIFARHGWIGFDTDYHQLQDYFVSQLPVDVPLYNEFHALLVRVGHHHCRKRPRCDGCPLANMLPSGGPLLQ